MKYDERKEFLKFLTSKESPPLKLKEVTQKDIHFTFNRLSILSKFSLLQLMGALITLTFCPQFGVGFSEGHGITHALRTYGDVVCATSCGAIFLSAGSVLASFLMDQDELCWIWKRYKFQLCILPAMFWFFLMFINLSWDLNSESVSYHLVWVLSAIFMQEAVLYIKTFNYQTT